MDDVTHGLFVVAGRRQYRGHTPGTQFEARLDPAIQRALDRHDLQLIELLTPEIPPGYRLPQGWPPEADTPPHTEAPKGASLTSEGGQHT